MKVCSKCGVEKPETEFYTGYDLARLLAEIES